jgi:hypothetical protein
VQSDQLIKHWHAYQGLLGEVMHDGRFFFAWKEGRLIGASQTLDEAMESLIWREKLSKEVSQEWH